MYGREKKKEKNKNKVQMKLVLDGIRGRKGEGVCERERGGMRGRVERRLRRARVVQMLMW